jgi:hypothetical protein
MHVYNYNIMRAVQVYWWSLLHISIWQRQITGASGGSRANSVGYREATARRAGVRSQAEEREFFSTVQRLDGFRGLFHALILYEPWDVSPG